jgi:hypothetical protein
VYGVSEHVRHEPERNDGHESHYDAPESPDQQSVQSARDLLAPHAQLLPLFSVPFLVTTLV